MGDEDQSAGGFPKMRMDHIAERIVEQVGMPGPWLLLCRLSVAAVLAVLFLIFPPGNYSYHRSSDPKMKETEAAPAKSADDSMLEMRPREWYVGTYEDPGQIVPTEALYEVLHTSPVFKTPNVSSNVIAQIRPRQNNSCHRHFR